MSLKNRDDDATDWTDTPSDTDNPPTGFPITRMVAWIDLDPRGREDPISLAFATIGSDVADHADHALSDELVYRFDPSGRGCLPLVVTVGRDR